PQQEAFAQLQHRPLEGFLKIERLSRRWLKRAVENQSHLLRLAVPSASNDGAGIMLGAGVDADIDAQTFVELDGTQAGMNAAVPRCHADKRRLAGDEPILDHAQKLIGAQGARHKLNPLLVLP